MYGYVANDPINFFDANGAFKLPANPSGLPPGWERHFSHKYPNGERWRYKNTDRFIDFHKGRPNGKKHQGKDHWHDSKAGEKCPDHLYPGDEVPYPVDPTMDLFDPASPMIIPIPLPSVPGLPVLPFLFL